MTTPCIQEGRIEKIEDKVDYISSINTSIAQIQKDITKVTSKVSYMEKVLWMVAGYCIATMPQVVDTVMAKLI